MFSITTPARPPWRTTGTGRKSQLARANGSATVTRTSNTLSEEMVLPYPPAFRRGSASPGGFPADAVGFAHGLPALGGAGAGSLRGAGGAALRPGHPDVGGAHQRPSTRSIPWTTECYEELTPLLRKLHAQQEENARQLATLKTQKGRAGRPAGSHAGGPGGAGCAGSGLSP